MIEDGGWGILDFGLQIEDWGFFAMIEKPKVARREKWGNKTGTKTAPFLHR
jgi:hypothetical protein